MTRCSSFLKKATRMGARKRPPVWLRSSFSCVCPSAKPVLANHRFPFMTSHRQGSRFLHAWCRWAMANPDGTEVLVYLSQAGSFQLRLPATATAARSTAATTTVAGSASDTIVDLPTRTNGGLGVSSSSSWDGEWFDPCTGQRQPFTVTLTAGQQQAFVPPKIYSATSDVALRLTAAKAA